MFAAANAGIAGMGGVYLGGRTADAWGPRASRQLVIGGHAVALLGIAGYALSGAHSAVVFGVLVAVWSVLAWGLNPPMQASMLAAAPDAGMSAMALNISALYLGAGALGGLIIDLASAVYIPLAGGALLLGALVLASAHIGPLGPPAKRRARRRKPAFCSRRRFEVYRWSCGTR